MRLRVQISLAKAMLALAIVTVHITLYSNIFRQRAINPAGLRFRLRTEVTAPSHLHPYVYTTNERLAGLAVVGLSLLAALAAIAAKKCKTWIAFSVASLFYLILSLGPGAEVPDSLPTSELAHRLFDRFYPQSAIEAEARRPEYDIYSPEDFDKLESHLFANFLRLFHVVSSALVGGLALLLAYLGCLLAKRIRKPRNR
jgi:hypothetical protein